MEQELLKQNGLASSGWATEKHRIAGTEMGIETKSKIDVKSNYQAANPQHDHRSDPESHRFMVLRLEFDCLYQ